MQKAGWQHSYLKEKKDRQIAAIWYGVLSLLENWYSPFHHVRGAISVVFKNNAEKSAASSALQALIFNEFFLISQFTACFVVIQGAVCMISQV